MKIELKEFTVRELVDGYWDDDEGGVVGTAASWIFARPINGSLSTRIKNARLSLTPL